MKQVICLLLTGILLSPAFAQSGAVKGSLDALIDWDNPWSLTPAAFKEIAEALPKKKSERAYNTKSATDGKVIYDIGTGGSGRSSGGGKLNLFDGELRVEGTTVVFDADKVIYISFHIGIFVGADAKKASPADMAKFKAELGKRTGDTSPKPYESKNGGGWPPSPGLEWTHRNYKVHMVEIQSFGPGPTSVRGTGVFNVSIVPLESK